MPVRKSYKWPLIIIGLLVVHTAAMLTAVTIASSDRSFAVIPNYYQDAVKWDQTKAAQQASDKLNWKVEIIIASTADPLGNRLVAVRIVDADGKAVEMQKVQLKYFHFSHGGNPHDVALLARDGKIEGAIPLRYEGFHEFNLTATAGEKVFVEKVTQYVNAAARSDK